MSVTAELSSQVVRDIIEMGRYASARGWVPATSGNFSRRIDAQHCAITRSGVDKGALGEADIALARIDQPPPHGTSAETPLHLARYRADDQVGAIMHVHSVTSTVLSRHALRDGSISLQGFEMQKAFAGVATHEGTLAVPVFANAQDTVALSLEIESRLGARPFPAYLLAGHGMYVWGANGAEARRHLEALEFLFACTLEERRFRP